MHQKLEESSLSQKLMSTDVSIDNYMAYMQKMKPVIRFSETNIFPKIEEIIPDVHDRQKFHLIQKDLDFFAKDETETTQPYKPFSQASVPFMLGYMYVIEGSTLGGRVILKHLAPRLKINEDNGGKFFAGYKEDTSAKWKSFLQYFSNYAVTNNCENEIISGANYAFETIYFHLES